MKLFNAQQIREIENSTFEHETQRKSNLELMEEAGNQFALYFSQEYIDAERVTIFCGKGNNGGDALVVARLLSDHYDVTVVLLDGKKATKGYQTNLKKLPKHGKIETQTIKEGANLGPIFKKLFKEKTNHVIIDGIFGLGLNRPLKGYFAKVIDKINSVNLPISAIDMPSGMFADYPSDGSIIQADTTFTFHSPKMAFFFPENEQYLGSWDYLPISFAIDAVAKKNSNYFAITPDIVPATPQRPVFSHKGTFGSALIVGGQYGMAGAALLTTNAALRSGCGKVTVLTPTCNQTILQLGAPEALLLPTNAERHLSPMMLFTGIYNVIGVGPGMGKQQETVNFLGRILKNNRQFVLDADALNILSENKDFLSNLPKNTILTPHPKEFERLAGFWNNGFERLEKQTAFSIRYQVFVIYKNAYTTITTPSGQCYFNLTGNPGMAKGGSGDILTGFLTGLLARGFSPLDACIAGVYYHGLAGDMAADKIGMESMKAGDMLDYL